MNATATIAGTAPGGTEAAPDAEKEAERARGGARLRAPAIVTTRPPEPEDAPQISRLIQDAGTLELNSTYAYILLSTHFSCTSVIAESGGEMVGCALGYRLPERPTTLFVWQIGVAKRARKSGIALRLLDALLRRDSLRDIESVEMTVAESNVASRRLFESWARRLNVPLRRAGRFPSEWFGENAAHETEAVLQVGPLGRAS